MSGFIMPNFKEDMKMDFTNLEEKLAELTGYDFEEAEKACRLKGDASPEISFSKDFQSRIAAKALGVKVSEIKKLSIPKYVEITQQVNRFLFSSLVEVNGQS